MASPSPWNLGGLSVSELGHRVWNEISKDEVADRAAALAYYFLFALFPTLLFLASLLGLLPLPGLMDRLLAYTHQAGNRIAATALQVAAAIAAVERFRHPRTDEEARARSVEERRAA